MIPKSVGYKATFNFFRMLSRLQLISKKRIEREFWLDIRDMLFILKGSRLDE